MKRFLICFAFCFMQWVGFSFCSSDEPVPAHFTEWKAETVVDESEIDRTGLDAWFKSEEISDDVFDRMWLKSWKEDCPLDRSDLRYLKMLHRNADGLPQRGEMVVNAAIADKVLGIFRRLYEANYRIERMASIDNYGANDETAMRANNSSSFNFRFMTGSTTKISKHDDLAYKLFTEAGFEWGGDWTSLKDYQHFEINLD